MRKDLSFLSWHLPLQLIRATPENSRRWIHKNETYKVLKQDSDLVFKIVGKDNAERIIRAMTDIAEICFGKNEPRTTPNYDEDLY